MAIPHNKTDLKLVGLTRVGYGVEMWTKYKERKARILDEKGI